MIKQFPIIILLAVLTGLFGCKTKKNDKTLPTQTNSQNMLVTVDTLKKFLKRLIGMTLMR